MIVGESGKKILVRLVKKKHERHAWKTLLKISLHERWKEFFGNIDPSYRGVITRRLSVIRSFNNIYITFLSLFHVRACYLELLP